MGFKARKTRERAAPEPVGKGTALVPSAAIRIWYKGQLLDLADAMVNDYASEIAAALKNPDVKRHFASDASPAAILQGVLTKLFSKWYKTFDETGRRTSKEFVDKSDDYATAATFNSMTTAGVKAPIMAYNSNVVNTLGVSRNFNHTLITGIHQDAHEKVYSAVMLSLTSPNPEQQGTSGIVNALREMGEFSAKRIDLIAQDQTSKLFSSLSDERLAQNGVDEFEWLHSSAGKTPRATHVEKDGKIFKLNDPRLWEGPKADQGPPGWAIHCRCRKRPVIL